MKLYGKEKKDEGDGNNTRKDRKKKMKLHENECYKM